MIFWLGLYAIAGFAFVGAAVIACWIWLGGDGWE
jgi:hypothetical protein